jgi:hypothetical protein
MKTWILILLIFLFLFLLYSLQFTQISYTALFSKNFQKENRTWYRLGKVKIENGKITKFIS